MVEVHFPQNVDSLKLASEPFSHQEMSLKLAGVLFYYRELSLFGECAPQAFNESEIDFH